MKREIINSEYKKRLASLPAPCSSGRLKAETQEELPPSLCFGDAARDVLTSSPSPSTRVAEQPQSG